MAKLRVVIADEDWTFLQTLENLLEEKFDVVGTAADGPSVPELIHQWAPDVVVLGLNSPVLNGTEIIKKLAMQSQNPPIVICSAEMSSAIAEAVLRAGAIGYVSKARISEDAVKAVQLAHQGRSFLSDGITRRSLADHEHFFKELGRRIRNLRKKANYSQEDMATFGFSARHWQQIETGRPTTITTLLRICDMFKIKPEDLIRGANNGIDAKMDAK